MLESEIARVRVIRVIRASVTPAWALHSEWRSSSPRTLLARPLAECGKGARGHMYVQRILYVWPHGLLEPLNLAGHRRAARTRTLSCWKVPSVHAHARL